MKAELKGLSSQVAEEVGAHLMAAMALIDDDPELAYRHAEAARRRAARLPITREATAETAYAAGLYEEALTQYKTLRRMTGSGDVIPVMVDCLRALGRHQDALGLIEEGKSEVLDPSMKVELIIVSAGVRRDMGQREEFLRILRSELEKPTLRHPRLAQARLLCAYADQLSEEGSYDEAYRGFALAARLDPEGVTPALDRLDELDGIILEIDESDVDGEAEDPSEDDDAEDLGEDDETEDNESWDEEDGAGDEEPEDVDDGQDGQFE